MRSRGVVRYKLLTPSPLIGFAKHQVARLIDAGLENFTRRWTVGEATITAHCVKLFEDYVVSLTISGDAAAAPSIAYPISSPASTPFAFTSELPSYNADDAGVPNDLGTLPKVEPQRSVGLAAATFSDDPNAPANVVAVRDEALFRSCVPAIVANPKTEPLAPSMSLAMKLFNDRHGAALVGYGTARLTIKRPATGSLTNILNEYLDAGWTPIHFYKEKEIVAGVEREEIWALCRNGSFDSNRSDAQFEAAQPNIPYTGNFDKDRFPATDLVRTIVDPTNGKPIVPPGAWQAHSCVLLKARLADLYAHKAIPARTVDVALGSSITYMFWGRTFSLPITPTVGPDGVQAAGVVTVDNPQYKLVAALAGVVETVDNVKRFRGKVEVESFGVYRATWDVPIPKPSSEIPIPSSSVVDMSPHIAAAEAAYPGNASEYFRTRLDMAGKHKSALTVGVPFEKGELIDLREFMSQGKPEYAVMGDSTMYDQRASKNPDGAAEATLLTCKAWSGYFSGVFFSAIATRSASELHVPIIAMINFAETWGTLPKIVSKRWGRVTHAGAQLLNEGELALETETQDVSVVARTEHVRPSLRREHRGAIEDLGSLARQNDGRSTFTPSTKFRAMGLTEYRSSGEAGFEFYEAKVHAETGYIEKYPRLWSPFTLDYAMGRSYKGLEIEAPILRPGVPDSFGDFVGNLDMPVHSDVATLGAPGVGTIINEKYYFDKEGGIVTATDRLYIDTYEYPAPQPFYAPASSGGTPIGGNRRARYKAVAIYWPNLKDGKAGFCLLKLGPDEALIRIIYFFLPFTADGITKIKAYVDKLHAHSSAAVYNSFPVYRANIATLKGEADALYEQRQVPPPAEDFARLKARALETLRSSFEIVVNNFASPELMDVFVESAVILPRG